MMFDANLDEAVAPSAARRTALRPSHRGEGDGRIPAAPTAAADRSVQTVLARRRLLVLALNLATVTALTGVMARLLSHAGWTLPEVGMMAAFLVTLPWLSIGLWNALIGTFVAGPTNAMDPLGLRACEGAPIAGRTALTMALRNEDADAAVTRLAAMFAALDEAGFGGLFDAHVLSDTDDPAIARREERAVASWRASSRRPHQIGYRRRAANEGYKAGNLQEFCAREGERYDFLLPLDADSYMSAGAVVRLVRLAEADPRIGILQSLVVGLPAASLFTRAFQFGMRHGMRAYTAGAAWWAGDCGPYWGHNALIRMAPFRAHCRLPRLRGDGPLGGAVMSHDQVEAVLMRRAGYHVRVIAEEGESWEENPPTLPDFIRRELRWCQGNMQYFKLLATPGLKAMSRVQLALAILMYLGAPAWMAFIALGTVNLFVPHGAAATPFPVGLGVALFATILAMSLAPKLLGLAGLLADEAASARYGGRGSVVVGAAVELALSVLMAPVVAFAVAVFAAGLVLGRRLDWRAQPRGDRRVAWGEAARSFAPQTAFGLLMAGLLAAFAPALLPWAAPVVLGFVLSIPFAVLTTSPALGRLSVRAGICDIPEDRAPPPALLRAGLATAPCLERGAGAEARL